MAQPGVDNNAQIEHVVEEAPIMPWYTFDHNKGHSCGENLNIDELTKKKTSAKRKAPEE